MSQLRLRVMFTRVYVLRGFVAATGTFLLSISWT